MLLLQFALNIFVDMPLSSILFPFILITFALSLLISYSHRIRQAKCHTKSGTVQILPNECLNIFRLQDISMCPYDRLNWCLVSIIPQSVDK